MSKYMTWSANNLTNISDKHATIRRRLGRVFVWFANTSAWTLSTLVLLVSMAPALLPALLYAEGRRLLTGKLYNPSTGSWEDPEE